MAKRQRNQTVRAAYNLLVKQTPNEDNPDEPIEGGFSTDEFNRILRRIMDTTPINDNDDEVISRIKAGHDLPFLYHRELQRGLHFGDFEGAYYGQRYRNNLLGEVSADSLNLRHFHYLISRLRDGKIVIGTTYHGQFGDFDGLRSCFSHLLQGNYRVVSKVLKNVAHEFGDGEPVSIKLTYRKRANRIERPSLFGTTGEIAIKKSDFGTEFKETMEEAARRIRGSEAQRRRILAALIGEAEMLEIAEDEIVGCSAVVRSNGHERTVYFIGENNNATRYPLNVEVAYNGVVDRDQIASEMTRVLRTYILPLIVDAQPA